MEAIIKYKFIYKNKINEIKTIEKEVNHSVIEGISLKDYLINENIFNDLDMSPDLIEITDKNNEDVLDSVFNESLHDRFDYDDDKQTVIINIIEKKVEEPEPLPEPLPEQSEVKDYNKIRKLPFYILNDKNKFFNWIYPTYEETSYKYVENTTKLKEIAFNEKQGQLFTKQFLVDSPYRGILLYHGLGTGKTCAGLITSENLVEKKHVLILTPASLRQTWIDELKFCGDPIYKKSNSLIYKNYTFINYNSTDIKKLYSHVKQSIYLDSRVSFINKDGEKTNGKITKILDNGKFTKNIYKPNEVKIIDDKNNKEQTYSILENGVKLIDNENPFDNKIIIFDEVHNFIVTIANIYKKMQKSTDIQQMKKNVYNDLKNAINCKIILLSGTPIVNNAYEISFISNILNGNNMIYKYDYISNSTKNKDDLDNFKKKLSEIKFINYVNIEKNFSKLSFSFMFNPDYFINTNNYEIQKEEENNEETQDNKNKEVNTIKNKLKNLKSEIEKIIGKTYTFKSVRKLHLDARIMPDDSETFEKLFLEKEYKPEYQTHIYKSIKNINLLKSLLAGKISYLRGDLPTKTVITTLNIPMGKLQEPQYVIARSIEIKMARRKRQNDDDNLSNLRSKSRQICNSFIPYIHKNKTENIKNEDIESEDMENEDMENEDIENEDIEEEELLKKNTVSDLKNKNVIEFIKNNIINTEEGGNKVDLILKNIKEYSCKCAYLIEAIRKTGNRNWINEKDNNYFPRGKVLIYSDFRELYSGGVSFIAELLSITDFGYIDFVNILDNLVESLTTDENAIYQEANWGTNETTKENKLFQEKVVKYFEEYQAKQYHNKTYYLWHTSSTQNMKINYLAKFVYNHIQNLDGKLLRIMFITKSGSEGISFKAVRQVHIMEPFWQQTRETQVIGRAVRYKSHDDLPDIDKNVFVYKYLSSFTNKIEIVDKDLTGDKNLTTDEYITEVSNKKQSIINSFYELVKEVALDCPYNNETLTCFSYNNIDYYENPEKNPFIFNDGISTYNVDIKRKEAYLVKKNNQKFIVYNNNLYDYEKYNLHKVLIKIGEIEKIGTKINFKITRDYSAQNTCFIQTNIKTQIEKEDFENIEYNIDELNPSTFSTITFSISGGSNEDSDEDDTEN